MESADLTHDHESDAMTPVPAPAPAPDPAPAPVAPSPSHPIVDAVDAWWERHKPTWFAGVDTEIHNAMHRAKEELKAELLRLADSL